jgi:hypothetical protein
VSRCVVCVFYVLCVLCVLCVVCVMLHVVCMAFVVCRVSGIVLRGAHNPPPSPLLHPPTPPPAPPTHTHTHTHTQVLYLTNHTVVQTRFVFKNDQYKNNRFDTEDDQKKLDDGFATFHDVYAHYEEQGLVLFRMTLFADYFSLGRNQGRIKSFRRFLQKGRGDNNNNNNDNNNNNNKKVFISSGRWDSFHWTWGNTDIHTHTYTLIHIY